jgi:hypothetical protein
MTKIAASAEEKEKLRRETERTLEHSEEVRLSIEETLRDHRRRMKKIRANLRRAGLLRD